MWDWAIWGALAVGILSTLGALAFLVVRVLQAWRDLKRARRHVFRGLDRLAEQGERAATTVAGLGENEELERSVAGLRRSLARLAVLRAALDEVQGTFDRVAAFVPRK